MLPDWPCVFRTSLSYNGTAGSALKGMRSVGTRSRDEALRNESSEPAIGFVNKVLSQSFVDGPGNRAVVFLQGCNFNCLYCHNPYMINLCNHCSQCVSHCPEGALIFKDGLVAWNPEACIECDACIQACPHNSSPQVRRTNPHDLWLEIEPFAPFLSGVTVSGGEAMQQAQFVRDFFTEVKAQSNLNTLIQTNGDVPREDLEELLPVTDWFMVDLKAFDPAAHRELTGSENERVMDTIRFLARHKKLFQVRQVVVPGFNDSEAEAKQTAGFLMIIDPAIDLLFLRFRSHGTRGIAEAWETPGNEVMASMVAAAEEAGLDQVHRSI